MFVRLVYVFIINITELDLALETKFSPNLKPNTYYESTNKYLLFF